jgi:hypothetical protein
MEQMWNSKEFDLIIDKIHDVLKQFELIPPINKESLKEFVIHISNLRENRLLEILEEFATDKSSIIDGLNIDQIRHFTETLSYLFLIFNPELYENEMKKIIKK